MRIFTKHLLAAIIFILPLCSDAQKNITFRSNLKYPGKSLAGIWGYADSLNNEYALVGTSMGMSIVDVTNPDNPVEKFFVPASASIWHEIKTWGKFAYMSSEGGGGMTIVDLSKLPASVSDTVYTGDGVIAGQLSTMHTLFIADGFVYMFGTNIGNRGAYVANLNDPWKPQYVGKYDITYVHDGYVRNDTLYACHIKNGYFSVVDFTDKSNPAVLATQLTPKGPTHNSWLSDDGKTLFITEETDFSFLLAYDVSNLSAIREINRFESFPGSGSVVHNTRIKNDYSVTSWYKDGVVIVDCQRPANLVKTGYYDTFNGFGIGQSSCWDVYPYLPSGNIIASTISEGMFVLTPQYLRACYLEGVVTDNASGMPISNVKVEISQAAVKDFTNITGEYKTGYSDSGTYTVTFYHSSYLPKTITGVVLNNSIVTNLDVQLDRKSGSAFDLKGKVLNSKTGAPVALAIVRLKEQLGSVEVKTNGLGNFTIPNFYPGSYEVIGGKWGYITTCANRAITNAADTLFLSIEPGIYDDFTFDYGWSVTSTTTAGVWHRDIPRGTLAGSEFANPNSDVSDDCSEECYITGNDPSPDPLFDAVKRGSVTLTSPLINLTQSGDPYVSYSRWFYNLAATADTLLIRITNGPVTKVLERITTHEPQWVEKNFRIKDFVTLTDSIRIIVRTSNFLTGSQIVEAGFDKFQIVDSMPLSVHPVNANNEIADFVIYPNPVTEGILNYTTNGPLNKNAFVSIYDISGREIINFPVEKAQGYLSIKIKNMNNGLYFYRYFDGLRFSAGKLIINSEK